MSIISTRLVRLSDVAGLTQLAATVEGFMTTMPRDKAAMQARVKAAVDSIETDIKTPTDEVYLFVLEENKQIIGISAVYATVGLDRPFYNYRVTRLSQVSPDLDVRVDCDVLHLVNDYMGASEVGTLYLHPDWRMGGRGSLLSYTRLMFMAAHRNRFPERVMAEMRGWTEEDGHSPFWHAVGRKFFKTELGVADSRSGSDFRFIADLMPKYPIYIDLLPKEAQQVIGVANQGAQGAEKLLRRQGFRYQNIVDIFDAGICLDAWIDDLHIVRHSHLLNTQTSDVERTQTALVANPSLENFAVSRAKVQVNGQQVHIDAETLQALGLEAGESALVYLMEKSA